ncbi:hypothetical protein [Lentibacillus sp. Marseille-P4043]|uniref:hypothetical protein n=1 Tax=Lentibacillus sp. Marseille-P4043 TaxID=2040293 RepID=UPI000D0BCAA1|nr:hypothetical protein [Lentibacillus sp. Marseille-P4043]
MDGSLIISEDDLKRYVELNDQKKQIDQEMKQLKNKFHQLLDDSIGKEEKGELERGRYKLQRQVRSQIRYHDETTVAKLEELNLEDCIVLVKRPDPDKLEAAIKLGMVDEAEFGDCKRTKVTQAIVVKETF